MEERSVGELPQHGCPLGVHDPSRGTVSNVGSSRVKRSCPLVVAKGLELDGNRLLTPITEESNRWGSLTGRNMTCASIR